MNFEFHPGLWLRINLVQEGFVKTAAPQGMRTTLGRQVGNRVFGIGSLQFPARRTAVISDGNPNILDPGIINEPFQGDCGGGKLAQVCLAVHTMVGCIWGLCVTLRTGLHFAPPGKSFPYSNPGISNLKEIWSLGRMFGVEKTGDGNLSRFPSPVFDPVLYLQTDRNIL